MTPDDVLAEIKTMSRENAADVFAEFREMSWENATDGTTWTARGGTRLSRRFYRPWWDAITAPTGHPSVSATFALVARLFDGVDGAMEFVPPTGRWTLPTYDGDRPADLSEREALLCDDPDATRQWWIFFDNREYRFDELWQQLGRRGWGEPRVNHAAVHRVLAGETYDQRYERIKAEGGVIRESCATEVTTAPTIAGCPHCARCER